MLTKWRKKHFFSTFLIPGLLAKSSPKSLCLSLRKRELVVPLPQHPCYPKMGYHGRGTENSPPSVPLLPPPAFHRTFPASRGAARLCGPDPELQQESEAAGRAVTSSPPRCVTYSPRAADRRVWLGFTPERPQVSGQRAGWFTALTQLSTGSQGSKILAK